MNYLVEVNDDHAEWKACYVNHAHQGLSFSYIPDGGKAIFMNIHDALLFLRVMETFAAKEYPLCGIKYRVVELD